MVKPILTALALSIVLTGCGMFGAEKPAPAPVAQVQPEPSPPPPPPPPPPLTHTVKKGETVAAIAKKFGVPAKQILAANNLRNAKAMKAGMVLTIPDKKAEPVAEKSAPAEKHGKAGKASKSDPYGIDAAMAPTKGKKKVSFKVDDEEKVKVGFQEYARKWLEKSSALSEFNKDHKEVKLEDGRYVASYSVILMNTMQTEVKRVEYDDTPYVGHITYQLEVHRSYGPTPQAAAAAKDDDVKQESMREIFSYSGQKHAWR